MQLSVQKHYVKFVLKNILKLIVFVKSSLFSPQYAKVYFFSLGVKDIKHVLYTFYSKFKRFRYRLR